MVAERGSLGTRRGDAAAGARGELEMTNRPILKGHTGGGEPDPDPEVAICEAWAHVATGYRLALEVTGLPREEADGLRRSLCAALQLAQQPRLALAR
jgi:hypothetical protein